jgi:hypothetical protein
VRCRISGSPARPSPLEATARRSAGRSLSESPPAAGKQQSRPVARRSGQLRHRSQPEKEGRQMAGRRGPGLEEAPVAQPTTVPTSAEPAPHQPRRARPPAASAGPTAAGTRSLPRRSAGEQTTAYLWPRRRRHGEIWALGHRIRPPRLG